MSKAFLFVVISLVTVMMASAGSFHLVIADPLHCDTEGWPSCYSVGYSNGLANPGTSCPSGHSDNYCSGWDAGSRIVNSRLSLPQPSTSGKTAITNATVFVKTLEPLTQSGEELTPDVNKSTAHNSGFAQGYLGFPLKGHHTPIFLAAYKNGTGLYWSNRGEAEGYYNQNPTTSEKKNSDYMTGWNQGQWIRLPSNVGFDKDFYPRPNQTNDNYLDYYVGDYNGAVAADKDDHNGGDDGTSNHCGSGHTQEYCFGHKAGYLVEAYLLNDA